MGKKVLVTGGLGYIGSHTVLKLIENGFEPIVVDNLSNSSQKVVERLFKISGSTFEVEICDVRDTQKIEDILNEYKPDSIVHFAALKSINESVEEPIDYYDNNVGGLISLLIAMRSASVSSLVFSSSAAVYGDITVPAVETMPVGEPSTPYGHTKVQCERILKDVANSPEEWSITILRYFNPVGAHESGLIGENSRDIPNNLMPYVSKVAAGKLNELKIFGKDYPTPDGTCIRDYIHVVDLAGGHVASLQKATRGVSVFNLGTGRGTSVKELIEEFEKTTGKSVPHKYVDRREGDLANVIADPTKALKVLGWKTKYDLKDMCRDAWNWQSQNPDGF